MQMGDRAPASQYAKRTRFPLRTSLMKTPDPHKGKKRLLRRALPVIVAMISIAAAGAAIWGFIESRGELTREAQRERPLRAPGRIAIRDGAPVIRIDAAAQERSGIETTRLPSAPYVEQVRAYGMVLDAARLTDLSNSYANAEAQLRIAQAKITSSKAAFERAQKLYDNERSVSLALLQSAEATFRADEAGVGAAESQVRTISATAYQEWGAVLGKSLVERSPTVARLIERQDFLLQVTLPPGIAVPIPPTAATIESPRKARSGITFVSPATRTDARIQGLSFFYLAPAESGVLPGMNVLAFLSSGAGVEGVAVPAEAVVWWQDRAWIYRRLEAETFVRTQIATDQPTAVGGYIDKNLRNDAEIVTRGAQLLLSEEFRARIQVGEDGK
jgi:hypothetical protein